MILLFAGMQTSLAMVYDREMGSMRVLLVSPLPRWYLLVAKLLAGTLVAVLQVYAYPRGRLVLGGRSAADRLSDRAAGLAARGLHARRAGPAAVLGDPAAGELRRA